MNEVTTSVLDARAAFDARARGAYARADALVPPGPVRAIDAVRSRFAVVDGGKAAKADEAAFRSTEAETDPGAPERGTTDGAQAGRGPGLLGGLTNFLARVFGQSGEGESVAPSSVRSGFRAYAQGAAAAAAVATEPADVDVSSPGFPRLSSGRALDLTV